MKTKPYAHQAREFELYKDAEARALFWQMRTGKTKAIIDNACYLYQRGKIESVIIVAPNGVHLNWVTNELKAHHWDYPFYSAFAWQFSQPDNQRRFEAALNYAGCTLFWFAVNAESLYRPQVKEALKRVLARGPAMVVFDESHYFGRPGAKRTAAARGLARKAAYRRILTGTPIENSPLRAFTQFELLEKGALSYTTMKDFEARYADMAPRRGRNGGKYNQIIGYKNLDELRDKMAKYTSVVTRADCADLPEILHIDVNFELEPDQAKLWRDVKNMNVEALLKHGFDALSGGALLTKLQQIEGGWLKTPEGLVAAGMSSPKLDLLLDEVADGTPTIVWAQYVHEIEQVHNALNMAGIVNKTMTGFHDPTYRFGLVKAFQDGKIPVLIIQPRVGGQGLNLSRADRIIWYSQTPDAVIYSQANERASAVGKKHVQIISYTAPGGVDEYFADLCRRKISLADDISRRGLQEVLERLAV